MTVTVDSISKSQTIIWEDGEVEVVANVIGGECSDPVAIELPHILEYSRGFNQFLSAIKKAMKATAD